MHINGRTGKVPALDLQQNCPSCAEARSLDDLGSGFAPEGEHARLDGCCPGLPGGRDGS